MIESYELELQDTWALELLLKKIQKELERRKQKENEKNKSRF